MKKLKLVAVVAALGLTIIIPAWPLIVNALFDFIKVTGVGNPLAGRGRVYVDSVTNQLTCLNSDGSSCMPSGGGGGGFIQTLTAPVSASFSQLNFNVGGTTTVQTNNSTPVTSITISQSDPSNNQETAALVKNKVAATFTITIGCAITIVNSAGVGGIFLYDGSSNNLFWGIQNQASFRGPAFSNLSGSFSADAVAPVNGVPGGPLAWFRIQETVSARNFYTSTDGVNFTLVQTESNTAHFTTSQYGWAVQNRAGGGGSTNSSLITVYSFTESNP